MKEPIVKQHILEEDNIDNYNVDDLISDIIIKQQPSHNQYHSYRFDSCLFDKVNLSTISFERAEFVDCIFDHCDISNATFQNAILHRCAFKSCNLVGVDMSATMLNNVSFSECKLMYTNFSFSTFKTVSFIDSLLRESELHTIEQTHLKLINCDCTKANFFATKLANVDISSSTIDGIMISPDCIQGLKVNSNQAIELASVLGIIVVD